MSNITASRPEGRGFASFPRQSTSSLATSLLIAAHIVIPLMKIVEDKNIKAQLTIKRPWKLHIAIKLLSGIASSIYPLSARTGPQTRDERM